MDFTLIRPPVYSAGMMGAQVVPVLGVVYLAAAAREAGFSVDLIDMCGEDIDRVEVVRDNFVAYGLPISALDSRMKASGVIGFSCMFSQDWVFHRELIQYVRRLAPDALFIAGGEHISGVTEFCLKDCPELDAVVVGEGEDVLVSLLETWRDGGDLKTVPGLVLPNPDGGPPLQTPRQARIRDVDRIPWPAWDLMPLENYLDRGANYHIPRGRTVPMVASRGCPFHCTFCSNRDMWGNLWRPRDPKDVVDEMAFYQERYQAGNFVFSDLTAAINKKKLIALCEEIIARDLKVTWQLPTLRTEPLDRDVMALMYRAGCRELDFAVESASAAVLEKAAKRNDPDKIVQLIRDGLPLNINFSINIVLGLPGEGYREFFETYILVLRLAWTGLQEMNAFPFTPYPGSELFLDFQKEGRLTLGDAFFLDLFGYADLSKASSWSNSFGPRTMAFLRIFIMASFYGLMFLRRPGRFVKLFSGLAGKEEVPSKLAGVLRRLFRSMRAAQTGK